MIKYCFVLDANTGLVQLGAGCTDEYYQEIGMEQRDVEQSEVDYLWYLAQKCPHYTPEEKLRIAKEDKYEEANEGAKSFLNTTAAFEFAPNYHVEATKENMNSFASAAMAIEKGLIPYQEWTSKEDNVRQLDEEECLMISMGIGQIQSSVWNVQFIAYKNAIQEAQTVDEVKAIKVKYHDV